MVEAGPGLVCFLIGPESLALYQIGRGMLEHVCNIDCQAFRLTDFGLGLKPAPNHSSF